MGRSARSACIIRLFALVSAIAVPWHAEATATAGGVALDAKADCSSAYLDITLSTAGATTEYWHATNSAGGDLGNSGKKATNLHDFVGTFSEFQVGDFGVTQPAGTLIGAYAWVGDDSPAASTTAEFFVYYNCTTREVLYSCFGAYGSCPATAQAAAGLAVPTIPSIPTLGPVALALTALVAAAAGGLALSRRRIDASNRR